MQLIYSYMISDIPIKYELVSYLFFKSYPEHPKITI